MSNEKPVIVDLPKSLNVVQCPCANTKPYHDEKGRSYTVLVDPQLKDGSAQLKLLVCNSCGHMVEVSEDALVGNKNKIFVDPKGNSHHRLKCDPINFGANLKQ